MPMFRANRGNLALQDVLHVKTLTFLIIVIATLLGILLLVAWSRARVHRALLWWSLSYFAAATGSILLTLRGTIPSFISIEIANGVVIVACACAWVSTRSFQGKVTPARWIAAPFAAWIALCQVPLIAQSVPARVVVMSLIMSAFISLGAYELWRGRSERLISRWPAIITMTVYAAALLSRIPMLYFIDLPAAPLLFQGTSWFGIVSVVSLIYIAMMACNILAMCKERMELGYRHKAQTDALTQLLSRRGFYEEAEVRMLALRGSGTQANAAVVLLDLDSFKQINDRFGHLVGDAVLQTFAEVARTELRSADVIGRIGGEEFALFLPAHNARDGTAVADRLRRAFEAAAREVSGEPVRATLSAGVASGADNVKLITLLSDADRALYAAKQAGRNCVRLANIDIVVETPSVAKTRAA